MARGDHLWGIAQETGCSVQQLRDKNGLEPGDVLKIGATLDVSGCATKVSKSAAAAAGGKSYVVKSGDTLSRIARRHHTTVDTLRSLNDLKNDVVVVGRRIRVPGKAIAPIRYVAGQSVGRPTRGKLRNPARLGSDARYYRRHMERTYGARHVIDHVRRAIDAVYDAHPSLHRMAIGDISAKKGGFLSGHHSHQSGRDVDLGLFYRRRPPSPYPHEFVKADRDSLNAAATWELVRALYRTAHRAGGVHRMFLDYDLQGVLYRYARKHGVSKSYLKDVFQYPDGKYAKHGIVRHEPLHDDHLHIRFQCPAGDGGCR